MQTETLRISPKLHKAVVHLQALPEVQQEQVVKQIEEFYQVLPIIKVTRQEDIDKEQELIAQDDKVNGPYTRWKKWHEKTFAESDDEWTDADHDAIWNNVRDKNDFGREPFWAE